MNCKYCNTGDLSWPENYVKGCRPLESDTNIEHTWERCQEMQKVNKVIEPKKESKKTYQLKSNLLTDYYIYHIANFRNV